MEQYKIRKDSIKEIRKTMLIKSLSISLLTIIGGLLISHYSTNGQQSEVNVYPYVIPILLVSLGYGLYLSVIRQKQIFDSYRLTIDINGITREQHNTPTINISNAEVREIIKNSNGSFTIKGKSSLNVIVVPSQIDNYEKLVKSLTEIRHISTKSKEPFLQKNRELLSLLTIGSLAGVYISNDKIIVGVSGSVLLGILGYSFFEVQRSKNVDNKTKNGMWLLILVIASIIGIMYYKLTGQQ